MVDFCKNGTCELFLRIQELPQDNSALLTASIAFLAVIISGLLSAFVIYITNKQSNQNTRRNWMDERLIEFVGNLSAQSFPDANDDKFIRDVISSSLLVSEDRSHSSELVAHLKKTSFESEGDFVSWQRELQTLSNNYLTN
ncbi:MAG: hypothetical protein AAGC93_27190 [Cyanobacteria bacterium P01_F01_bin.53]